MISSRRLAFATDRHTEFLDLTSRLQETVEATGLRNGRLYLQSLHTTLGLMVNENEPLLLSDLETMLDRLVPGAADYRHDDFASRTGIGEDEPANGPSHCRQVLLQPSLVTLVEDGSLLLGRWQSIFAVELDGPRRREIAVQLEGEFGSPPGPALGDPESRLIDLELGRQLEVDPEAVGGPMRRLIGAGGKRLRPRLVLLTARLGGRQDPLRAAVLAASIELIHNATLVHDDYVDDSPRRHGEPTVAATEGPERAIAVGDYYFAKATRLIAELGEPAVTTTVAAALEAICRSQIDDLNLRGSYPGDHGSYLRVVRGKTAALISAACTAGAQLAGAPPEVVRRLRRYGELLGIAFQMADDVVDFSTESGKPVGQDIRQRALSLPLIYATEDVGVGAEIRSLLAGPLPESEVQQVVALVTSSGALDRVRLEARSLAQSAVEELTEVDLDGARSTLVELAMGAADRRS